MIPFGCWAKVFLLIQKGATWLLNAISLKKIWLIELRNHDKLTPNGHIYKDFKKIKFTGTKRQLDNEIRKKYSDKNMFITTDVGLKK